MRLNYVEFIHPPRLPGGKREKVISLDHPAQKRRYKLDYDRTTQMIRVEVIDGKLAGQSCLVHASNTVNLNAPADDRPLSEMSGATPEQQMAEAVKRQARSDAKKG
jgi:hypothetical protein